MLPVTLLYEEEKWKYQKFQSFLLPVSIHALHQNPWEKVCLFFLYCQWIEQFSSAKTFQCKCPVWCQEFVAHGINNVAFAFGEQLGKSSSESSLGAAWPRDIVIAHFDKSYWCHPPYIATTNYSDPGWNCTVYFSLIRATATATAAE